MSFWLIAGVMVAAALAFAVVPLVWRRGRSRLPERQAYDIAVYRDQLKELEVELGLEEISRADAATARLEIERRILRAAHQGEATLPSQSGQRRPWILAAALSVFVTALGLGLYTRLGSPDMPDHPFIHHENDKIPDSHGETVEALVDKLMAYLKDHPDNMDGWIQLRQAMGALGKNPEAAQLLQKAVATRPGDADLRVMYGESLMVMSDGQVTPAAKLAFEQVLTLAPHHPGAEYYLALGAYQAGDIEAAYKGWTALAAEAPADAPWLPQVVERIRDAAEKLGRPAPPLAQNGPAPDQQAAAQAMSPAAREAMIREMVQKFADRMKANPKDYEGWQRLGRAYEVLGEKAKAVAALMQALSAAPAAEQAAIQQDIARVAGQK